MERELTDNLRAIFETFSGASSLAASTIWARAVGDARFLQRIEGGASFTVKTYDRAIAWFSANWPSEAEWPAAIARPAAPDEAAE